MLRQLVPAWLGLALLAVPVARAQQLPTEAAPAATQNPVPGPGDTPRNPAADVSPFLPGYLNDMLDPQRSTVLGNVYGLRTALDRYGVSVGLLEASEVAGNVSGGLRRGTAYNGLTTMSLGVDTAKAINLPGGTFNVSAFQIHGRSLTTDNLGVLQSSSGIQAQRATRLWELWYQQSFADGALDVKLGQQSLDVEFIGSQGSGLFINTAMGWPLLPAVNLYAGGPAYPLSSLGARLRVQPGGGFTVLAGVFDDSPTGRPFTNPSQVAGAAQSGTRFNTDNGALAIAEVQWALNPPDKDGKATGLAGVYKLGGWYDTGRFLDQRFDAARMPLADPASSGVARGRRGNFSIYGVADQTLWRDGEGKKVLAVFARLMGGPGDRNLAQFSVNAGVTLKAPLAGRDNDTLGLGFGLARIGSGAIRADRDVNNFNGPYPVRGSESFVELTYQVQLAPWLVVQPDAQYTWTPAGGVPNPRRPGERIGNILLFGARTTVAF